jgi:phytoene synthase
VDPLVEQSLRTIQHGSKSFALAARLFDAPTREGAILLYAWCRHWNDQIDGLWARPRG